MVIESDPSAFGPEVLFVLSEQQTQPQQWQTIDEPHNAPSSLTAAQDDYCTGPKELTGELSNVIQTIGGRTWGEPHLNPPDDYVDCLIFIYGLDLKQEQVSQV